MTSQQFAALFGFLFVAAWAALGFGDAILCLIGAAVFWAAGAFYRGELDLASIQERAQRSGLLVWVSSTSVPYEREKTLLGVVGAAGRDINLPAAPYLERNKPQYEDKGAGDFVHLKDYATGGWAVLGI